MTVPVKLFLLGFGGFWLLFLSLFCLGFRINISSSLPLGLYQASFQPVSNHLNRGSLVLFCLPDSSIMRIANQRSYLGAGPCPGRTLPLLKPVLAVAGDTVSIQAHGVKINDAGLLPQSQRLSQDSQGRVIQGMPNGVYRVKPGEIWVLSTYSPRSFDSRYFGPVPIRDIQATVTPIMTGS